ncbi:MAG TPA: hypothetical protein VIG78_00100 [Gemmatimonadaceae bacterium]
MTRSVGPFRTGLYSRRLTSGYSRLRIATFTYVSRDLPESTACCPLLSELTMRDATSGRLICAAAALAVVAGCTPLQAQSVSLEPGTRVRVFTPSTGSGGLAGSVVALEHDTLTLWPEKRVETVAVALSELSRLELSKGMHTHALKGCGIGLLLGATGGAIAGHLSGDDQGWFGLTANEKAVTGAVVFGVAGALVGLTIGSHFGATEEWASVRLPSRGRLGVAPRSGAPFALVYSVAF